MTRTSQATALLTSTLICLGCQEQPAPEPEPAAAPPAAETLASDEDKMLYAMGVMIGQQLKPMQLESSQLEKVLLGLKDSASGVEPKVSLQEHGPRIQEWVRSRAQAMAGAEKARSREYLERAAAAEGAVKTGSGLVFRTLKPGSGASPGARDRVKVHYVGTLTDGTEFDSSRKRGEPAEFPLDQVVACWGEGVQMMKVGETAQLVCPSDIAYGDQGSPPVIGPGATLVFEVELLDIVG